MQGPRQGAHGRGHHRIGIGEGAGGDAGAEGAGVEAVLRVQDQAGVEDAGGQGVRLPLGKHVEEVSGVGQIVAGLNRILALADQLKGRHHRRDLGDQTDHRRIDVFGIIEGAAGIEEPERGGAGLQGIHRVPLRREALHHVADAEAHPPVHLHLVLERRQLVCIGQFTPDQQEGRLQEGAAGSQLIDPVTAVGEQALLAVDVTHRRLGGRDPLQAGPVERSGGSFGGLDRHRWPERLSAT